MSVVTPLLTLEEAAKRLGIKPRTLIRYAKSGKIKAKLFVVENGEHMMLVELEEMTAWRPMIHQDQERDEPDEAISLSEASRRYGVPQPLLSRWVKYGLLEVVERGSKECRVSAKRAKLLASVYHEEKEKHGSFKGKHIRKLLRQRGL